MSAVSPGTFSFGAPPIQDTTLLVPIDVAALVVGPSGVQAVPTETVIPNSAPNSPESATLPRPPQPFGDPFQRAPGVHLHWAMPDGLTRGNAGQAREGTVAAGNPTGLPALPDRWIVVRFQNGLDNIVAFAVDADIGRSLNLVDWVRPAPLPDGTVTTSDGHRYFPGRKLTAVAGGDLAWAATYDAVVNRFAFRDQLLAVHPTAQLSYLVMGWWSSPANNPLAGITTIEAYKDRMAELGWQPEFPYSVPQPPPPPTVPQLTVLHGLVSGISANGSGGVDFRPDGTRLELGLGGTAFGALAALLGDGTGEQRAATERILAAFSSGLLARIDQTDGLAAVDEDRHSSAFVGVSAGPAPQPDRVRDKDVFDDTSTPPINPTPPPPVSLAADVTLQHRDAHAVLGAAFAAASSTTNGGTTTPSPYRDVPTSQPRCFTPADLALVVRGAGRSLRHGEDSRFVPGGLLPCRLMHNVTLDLGFMNAANLPAAMQTLPNSAGLPKEFDFLLREAVLVDPMRGADRTRWAGHPPTSPPPPDPIWVNRWLQPWVPLWCDWELGVRVDDDLRRWELGPVDFVTPSTPDAAAEMVLSGRMLLTATAGKAFAAQVHEFLDAEHLRDQAGQGQASPETEAALAAAAAAADSIDLLGGTFRGLREELLGLDAQRSLLVRIDAAGNPVDRPPVKALPRLLAGGAATVRRLRIVDAFGRYLDVPPATLAGLEVAATHVHPAGAPRLTLAPRLQRPSRLLLRFVDPGPADTAAPVEARIDQENPELAVSPVAGWLLPDHVDEALECFDAEGRPLGQLMHDELTEAVVFEEAPGRPGSIGGPPESTDPATRHVTRFAAGLVAADAAARNSGADTLDRSALSALLRAVDTTLWTVDPLGSVGTAAVAGLVGRPIAVVRATLSLDVLADAGDLTYPRPFVRADRERAYAELAARALCVRLGELTRTDDGLLAYFVDDDYSTVRLVAPEVRSHARVAGLRTAAAPPPAPLPIGHPYTDGPTDVLIRSAQTVRLTLLMNPGGKVHVTSGVAPRKALALSRDWFHGALERLSPSFRVGPVLVDPTGIRMPRVTGLGDRQTFTRRTAPLTWRDDAILAASQTALLPDDPAGLQEGWIRVVPSEPDGAAS